VPHGADGINVITQSPYRGVACEQSTFPPICFVRDWGACVRAVLRR